MYEVNNFKYRESIKMAIEMELENIKKLITKMKKINYNV